MKKNRKGASWNILMGVLTSIIILCFAVSITVWFRPLYYFDIIQLEIPQNSGIDEQHCRWNYDALIDYNTLGGTEQLEFPTIEMSQQGRIHFEEVREIFLLMQVIGIAGGFLIILGILLCRRWSGSRKHLQYLGWIAVSVRLTACGTLLVLGALLIDWEWTFEMMHNILFQNDLWIFDERTDPVIKILPETFFFHCGIMIVSIIFVIVITLEIYYRKMRKKV